MEFKPGTVPKIILGAALLCSGLMLYYGMLLVDNKWGQSLIVGGLGMLILSLCSCMFFDYSGEVVISKNEYDPL